jgi:lysophospholipase L1-like esterase
MMHGAVSIPCNAHLGQSAAAAGTLRTSLGVVVTLLFLGGCVEIRVPDPNVRYVAFGDSSTSGPSTRDYPDILRSLLDEAPETFANEGGSGETSGEGLARLKSLLADGIFPNADVLLYWEGGNDIIGFIKDNDPFLLASPDDPDYPLSNDLAQRLAETQANIESAVAAARNAGLRVHAATYFLLQESIAGCDALPLDVVLPAQARNANVYIARLNERIRAAAANQGAVLVDVAAADDILRQNPANYFDCNHLSEQGNTIVANLFHQAIVGPTN